MMLNIVRDAGAVDELEEVRPHQRRRDGRERGSGLGHRMGHHHNKASENQKNRISHEASSVAIDLGSEEN